MTQVQPVGEYEITSEGVSENVHRMYLIEYYSRLIPESSLLTPIALLELESLFLCMKHWSTYIRVGFKTYIYTDSRYVSYWASLELCSEKVARFISFICEFNVEIIFLPSELNPADILTRMNKIENPKEPTFKSPFGNITIRNAKGVVLTMDELFSIDKRIELNEYFKNHKRGNLAKILKFQDWLEERGTMNRDSCNAPKGVAVLDSPPTRLEGTAPSLPHSSCDVSPLASEMNGPTGADRCRHSLAPEGRREEGTAEAGAGAYLSGEKSQNVAQTGKGVAQVLWLCNSGVEKVAYVGRQKSFRVCARRRRKVRREELKKLRKVGLVSGCTECECMGDGEVCDGVSTHCTCLCRHVRGPLLDKDDGVRQLKDADVGVEEVRTEEGRAKVGGDALLLCSTERQLAGAVPMDIEDVFKEMEMPSLEGLEEKEAREGQEGMVSDKIRKWIGDPVTIPRGDQALALNAEQRSVLSQLSLYKLNKQNIIFRLFIQRNGEALILIYVEENGLNNLVRKTHEKLGHANYKAVFEVLSKKYFSNGLRRKINEFIKRCIVCIKYNNKKTIKSKQSTLLATQSRRVLHMDLAGPMPKSRGCSYLFVAVDCFDRFVYLKGLKSTAADDMASLLADFFVENGAYNFIHIDHKCVTLKQIDKKLLDGLGIGIVRANHCSRHQSYAERAIQSSRIKILKYLENEPDLRKWVDVLPAVQSAMNLTPIASLGWLAPVDIRYTRPPVHLTSPIAMKGEISRFSVLVKMAEDIRNHAWRSLMRNKEYHRPDETLYEGEIVWRKRLNFARNMNAKLQQKIVQAFEAVNRVGTGMYRLRNLLNGELVVLPLDQLIRTNLSKPEVLSILAELTS